MSATHPDAADWLDLLRDRIAKERADAMRRHLGDGCPRCELLRDWASRVLASVEEPLTEPPAAAISRARALFREHRPRGLREKLRTLVATLLPPAEPALAAAREAPAPDVARTWEAGPYVVEVLVDPAPRRRRTTLRGRVVSRDTGLGVPGIARLRLGGKVRSEAALDDLGEVILRDVVVADRVLELLVEGGRIELRL